jgi:hypothetical protein
MHFVMDGEMPEYLLAKDLILQVRQGVERVRAVLNEHDASRAM